MFLFKKVFTFFLAPFNLGIVLAVVGIGLLWFGKEKGRKRGKVLVTVGVLWLVVFGLQPVAHTLIRPLENQYLATGMGEEAVANMEPVPGYVVVLAAGHRADPGFPVSSHLGYPAMQRLAEGVRLHNLLPGSKLVLSGGMLSFGKKECETMRDMALGMGVEESGIILEGESRDTASQAVQLKAILQDKPFLLVTSANHMLRSVTLLAGQGLDPIPAPTAFTLSANYEDPDAFYFPFPAPAYLGTSHRALHEHVGSLWAKLRGQD